MRFDAISRRHFLQGVGAGLVLPFLPSLAPKAARAQMVYPKFFVAIGTPHGNVPIEDWAPIEAPGQTEVPLYPGSASEGRNHTLRSGNLLNMTRANVHRYNPGGTPELTRVLGHFLNPYLGKCSVISGLDVLFYTGHHRAVNLGNFRDLDDQSIASRCLLPSMPTIDRVIARSPTFYPAGDPFTVRSIHFDSGLRISNDGPVGSVSATPNTGQERPRAAHIFDAVFGTNWSGGGSSGTDPRLGVVDRVLADYNRVVSSPYGDGARISSSDRARLDEFISGLRDTETKIANQSQSCDTASRPDYAFNLFWSGERHADEAADWAAYMGVIKAAFQCGLTRVATIGTDDLVDDFTGDWHTEIAHRGNPSIAEDYTIRSHRFAAQAIFTSLISQLDVSIDGESDTTYLDQSIVVWNHESGQQTHYSVGIPTVVAGSAGGYLRTGRFLDYRNLSNDGIWNGFRTDLAHWDRPGIPYNRWLYTMLRAMGIPDAEYKVGPLAGMQGYGDPYVRNDRRNGHFPYSSESIADMGLELAEMVA